MCHSTDSKPPEPIDRARRRHRHAAELVLTSRDGARFSAFGAVTSESDAPGVVILPDVRGLHPYYRDLAERFAATGIHATAIDYFGRTAALGRRQRDFDYAPHVEQTRDDTIAMDVGAAVAHLRSEDGGGASLIWTIGFCFGGRNSFNQAARRHELSGVIGFYGRVVRHEGDEEDTPVELAHHYQCPVLGLFGGMDRSIPREDVDAFRAALDRAGVPNELVVYDDAPHSFFDRSYAQFREVCDDAWRRVLHFILEG
jgi:carboxymethylenebutenolidase